MADTLIESDSEVTVRRLGKIINTKDFFAQSGGSIRRVAWKWSGETRSYEFSRFSSFCPD